MNKIKEILLGLFIVQVVLITGIDLAIMFIGGLLWVKWKGCKKIINNYGMH